MPIYTREDFLQDSIHQLLFDSPEYVPPEQKQYLEIIDGTTYTLWTEDQPKFETDGDEADFHLSYKVYNSIKCSQEMAYILALKARAESSEDDQLSLDHFFDYNPDNKKLQVKPEYSKDYAKFLKEVKNLDKRPWYKRLFDALAWFVASIPDFIIAAKDAIVWACKWLGNKMFGTAHPNGTNPNPEANLGSLGSSSAPAQGLDGVSSTLPPCCQQPQSAVDLSLSEHDPAPSDTSSRAHTPTEVSHLVEILGSAARTTTPSEPPLVAPADPNANASRASSPR